MNFLEKVRRQKYLSFTVMLFTLSIGILIGTVLSSNGVKASSQTSNVAPGATALTIPSPVQLQNQFSALAKLLEPSVVNISIDYIPQKDVTAKKMQKNRRTPQVPDEEDNGGGDDSGMQQFMQRFFGGGGGGGTNPFGDGGGAQREQRSQSLGSGVVVDRNGYILTNNHVVEKATRMRVKFSNDDTEYDAKLIGTDPMTDLAVIHVSRTDLVPAKIGNSDAVQVGDWAVAIGSPFGFEATVTAGIISAKQRRAETGQNSAFQPFIQTDAAINPGNSGGPLLNINGEVIGINTMIASRSGGYQGIGFAMPINSAVRVYNDIIKSGHVTRGSIGIQFQPTDMKELVKAYGAKSGVFVGEVKKDGPADRAGVKAEDVIVSIGNKPVKDGNELIEIISSTPVGNTVKLGIMRDHSERTVEVAVGDREKIFAAEIGGEKPPEAEAVEPTQAKFGIQIKNLTDGLRTSLGYKGKGGVVVDRVEQGSFAEDILMLKGDIIESMTVGTQRIPILSVDDIQKAQAKLKTGDSVAFKVARSFQRGGEFQSVFLAGSLPAMQ